MSAVASGSSGDSRGAGALVRTADVAPVSVPTVTQPEILKHSPRPVDLIYALRRRWGWALGLGILSAAAAVIVATIMIPVEYRATAWLRIAEEKPQIMFDTKTGDSFLNERRAQATLMTSNFVLNAALRKPGIAQLPEIREEEDPVQWLRENVHVSFPGGSEILQIAMSGEDPGQLVKIVNAVKDAYMEEVVSVDRESHLRRKRVLEQNYQRNMQKIEQKAYLFNELANQLGTADSDAARIKEIHALDTLNSLRNRVNELRGQIRGMEQKVMVLKARVTGVQEEENEELDEEARQEEMIGRMAEMALQQDPWIAHSTSQLQQLEIARVEESLRAKDGENAPSVERIGERMEVLQETIAKRREELLPQLREMVREQVERGLTVAPATPVEKMLAQIEETELAQAVLEKERDEAMAAFENAAKEAEKLGSYSAELDNRKVELDRLKKITHKMGNELEQWEIELAAAPRVTVLEPATVPRSNNAEEKYRKVAFIGLAAFAVAILGVAAVDFMSRRVNSPDEVAYGLGVHVMGDVPLISGTRSRRTRVSTNGEATSAAHGMLIESIDNIRTALLHRANTESLQVVMVTSSLEKEGKTTVASQLAASLARSGRRTLLVDGDLRRPSAHRMFELPVAPGLAEVLRSEADLEEIIRPTRVAGLWLGPAGVSDADAVQALAQDGLHEAFEQIRSEFDFVVIDTGPVLTDADALLFGKHADAVILSILRDVSRVPRVYEACQRLRSVDLRLLGAVINGVGFGKYRPYYRPYTIEVESSSV